MDQYPLPSTEDLFATVAGGQVFSKIDLSHAYQQVELDEDSQKYLTQIRVCTVTKTAFWSLQCTSWRRRPPRRLIGEM